MILQTGQEINELDQSGFFTQGPTVFTGNLGGSKYIVQVKINNMHTIDLKSDHLKPEKIEIRTYFQWSGF